MKRTLSALVLLALTLPLSGCSLIGGAIGASIDSSKPDSVMFSRTRSTDSVRIGEETTVSTLDDSTLSGECAGFRQAQAEQYQQTYQKWLDTTSSGRIMPLLWKKMTLAGHSSRPQPNDAGRIRFDCRVVGFDPSKILVAAMKGRGGRPFSLALVDTLFVDEQNLITGPTLRHIVEVEHPPLLSMIGLCQGADTLWVPLDRVRGGYQKFSKNATGTGFLIGLGVDVCVVIVELATIHFTWTLGPLE